MAETKDKEEEEVNSLEYKLHEAVEVIKGLIRGSHFKEKCGCSTCSAKRFIDEVI